MRAAERADRVVERTGPLEVAQVACAREDDERRVGDRLLELAGHLQRRARVELAPDEQRRHGDARQQVALIGGSCQTRPLSAAPWTSTSGGPEPARS